MIPELILILLLLLLAWYHYRIHRVEQGVRWILEHVRIVSQSQEDKGYAHIRKMFGIEEEEDPGK